MSSSKNGCNFRSQWRPTIEIASFSNANIKFFEYPKLGSLLLVPFTINSYDYEGVIDNIKSNKENINKGAIGKKVSAILYIDKFEFQASFSTSAIN
jgi:hypothetical protein